VPRLLQASSFWSQAERTARARAAAQPVTKPTEPAVSAPPPTQSAPPPAAQPVVDPRPQIEAAIAAYGRAIENRDMNALRQSYPSITRRQQDTWQGFFGIARDVKADVRATDIQVSGDHAETPVTGTLSYQNTNTRRGESLPLNFHAQLQRQGSGWIITAVQ
jgi:hypothetical protein